MATKKRQNKKNVGRPRKVDKETAKEVEKTKKEVDETMDEYTVYAEQMLQKMFDWVLSKEDKVPEDIQDFVKDFRIKADFLYKGVLLNRLVNMQMLTRLMREVEFRYLGQKLEELDADQLLRYYKGIERSLFDNLDLIRKVLTLETRSEEDLNKIEKLLLSLPEEMLDELAQASL